MVDIWTNIYIKTVGAIELLDNAFHKMMNKITHNTVEKQQKNLFNPDLSNLQDKVVIITGGNAGIGKATAKFLVEHGAHVIIACRSLTRGENAVKDIEKSINQNLTDKTWYNEVEHKIQDDGIAGVTNGNIANKNVQNFGQIEVQQLDLCSYNSIQKFVKDFKGDFDILICNAGIMVPPKRILSENNLEAQFQTNYLGHWLLTNLLLQKTQKVKDQTQNKRIVMLSSMTHRAGNLNIESDDFSASKDYEPFVYYAKSKLAVVLGVNEFQRRFDKLNLRHVAVACHPGLVATEMADGYFLKYIWPKCMHPFIEFSLKPLLPYLLLTTEVACLNIIQAVTASDEIVKGKYVADMKLCSPSKKGLDLKLAKDLWEYSEQATGKQFLQVEELSHAHA